MQLHVMKNRSLHLKEQLLSLRSAYLLPLIPVLLQRNSSDVYQAYNISIFYACAIAICLYLVIKILLGQSSIKFNVIDAFSLSLYTSFLAIELYRGVNINISDTFWVITSVFAIFVGVRASNFSAHHLHVISSLLILVSLVLGMIGIYQLFSSFWLEHRALNIKGTSTNTNLFTAYLCITLPFSMHRLLNSRCRYSALNLISFINIMLVVFICLVTLSRMSLLISLCMVIVMPLMRVVKRLKRKHILGLATLMLTGLFLISFFVKKDSSRGRLLIWKVASTIPLEKPWLGTGAGKFKAVYNSYQAKYFSHGGKPEEILLAAETFSAFNEPLEVLIEYGLLGLTGMSFLLYIILKPRWYLESNHKNGIETPFLISVYSTLAISLTSYPFSELPILAKYMTKIAND